MLRHWPVFVLFLGTGCGLPRDPEDTTERIAATHELRVGVSDNRPWAAAQSANPQGIEPALVRAFARRIGAHVRWSRGSETRLAQALKHHELDLAIAGFDAKTPWKTVAGVSQPYAETSDGKKLVMLVPPGENGYILRLDTFLSEQLRASKGTRA